MAVIIDIIDSPAVVVNRDTTTSTVIEVLKGAPGDDKVYVGPTPPSNPQEGWIWIDTSG